MKIDGVVILDKKSGIPLHSKLRKDIDADLFSSFISAIGHFSQEVKLGGLSSFATEKHQIFLAPSERVVTALITPRRPEFERALSMASELGAKFEEMHHIPERPQPEAYNGFAVEVDEFLRLVRNPFISNVAEFVHNEYGGEIQVKPRLLKKNGSEGIMDLIITKDEKIDDEDDGKNILDPWEVLAKNMTFCKVYDGQLSRGAMMEFVDSVDGYGVRIMNKGKLEFKPYFPKRAIVVARDYSPSVFEYLKKLPKENGSICIDGSHVFAGLRLKKPGNDAKCLLDIWKWYDNASPEKVKIN